MCNLRSNARWSHLQRVRKHTRVCTQISRRLLDYNSGVGRCSDTLFPEGTEDTGKMALPGALCLLLLASTSVALGQVQTLVPPQLDTIWVSDFYLCCTCQC